MMVYVNGADIARLELGTLKDQTWIKVPEVLEVRPEQYLAGLESWLDRNQISRADIGGFVLISGPGSATALRASHAMVNALAFALKVEVTSIEKLSELPDAKPHAFALPAYARDPSITKTTRDALKRKIA